MTLDARRIATFGIAGGALAVAAFGLLGQQVAVQANPPGVHKSNLKFTPIQDAEAYVDSVPIVAELGDVISIAHAVAEIAIPGVYTDIGGHIGAANASAPVSSLPVLSLVGNVEPEAEALVPVTIPAVAVGFTSPEPVGFAVAWHYDTPTPAYSELGEAYPYGIQNPTDEELVAIVLAATRKKKLDKPRAYL